MDLLTPAATRPGGAAADLLLIVGAADVGAEAREGAAGGVGAEEGEGSASAGAEGGLPVLELRVGRGGRHHGETL